MADAASPAPDLAAPAPLRARLLAWLRPRPAEYVVLAFLGYTLVRAATTTLGPKGKVGFAPLDGEDIVGVLWILVYRLFQAWRATPWRRPGSRLSMIYPATILLLGAVLGLDLVAEIQSLLAKPDAGGLGALWVVVRVSLVATPLLIAWLALGVHAKRNGALALGSFLRTGLPRAVDVAREFLPVVVLISSYSMMGDFLVLQSVSDKDWLMARIDRFLFFGHDPLHLLEKIIWAPLSEWLAFAYIFYVPLFAICLGAVWAKKTVGPFRELAFAVTLTMAVGYVTYTLVPVMGPTDYSRFATELNVGYLAPLKEGTVDRYRIPRDCFPSLHTAASLVLLWGMRRHSRKLFWVLLPIVGSIPFACVYLRYHYVVDVLAGIALAVLVWVVTPRVVGAWEQRHGAQASDSPES